MQHLSQESGSDRRVTTRASLYLAASLYCDGSPSPVKIRNISATGALLESQTQFTPGALVQLVRGSLIVHGLVAWSEKSRSGLKFSGSVDVNKWRSAPMNAEQQRVDEIVRVVKAGAVPLPESAPAGDPWAEIDDSVLARDLLRASDLLGTLGERLAKDAIVIALYPDELQNLDIAMQMISAVADLLGERADFPPNHAKFVSLRKSADQALSRAAA